MTIPGKLDAADMKRAAPFDVSGQVRFGRFFGAGLRGLHLQVHREIQNPIMLALGCGPQTRWSRSSGSASRHSADAPLSASLRCPRDFAGGDVIQLPGVNLMPTCAGFFVPPVRRSVSRWRRNNRAIGNRPQQRQIALHTLRTVSGIETPAGPDSGDGRRHTANFRATEGAAQIF